MVDITKASTLSPIQSELIELIKQGLISGEGPFKDIFGGFNEQDFEEGITKPALQNFQEKILPQLQEKFVAGNQAGGSGMRRGQLKASKDLQKELAGLRYQAQQGALKNKLSGIDSILGKQSVENIVEQPAQESSIWDSIIPAVGTAAGGFLGGPGGEAAANFLFKKGMTPATNAINTGSKAIAG